MRKKGKRVSMQVKTRVCCVLLQNLAFSIGLGRGSCWEESPSKSVVALFVWVAHVLCENLCNYATEVRIMKFTCQDLQDPMRIIVVVTDVRGKYSTH